MSASTGHQARTHAETPRRSRSATRSSRRTGARATPPRPCERWSTGHESKEWSASSPPSGRRTSPRSRSSAGSDSGRSDGTGTTRTGRNSSSSSAAPEPAALALLLRRIRHALERLLELLLDVRGDPLLERGGNRVRAGIAALAGGLQRALVRRLLVECKLEDSLLLDVLQVLLAQIVDACTL